jgi:uncharacterized protein (TIRG00374 family)
MLRQKRFWLGFLISLALLAYLFHQTDLVSIGAALSGANYVYLLPALILYFIGVGIRAVRWHFLLRSIKPVSLSVLFPVVVIGYMANDLLPARIGELVRAVVLGEEQSMSKASILVTIFVERLFDGLTMIAFIAGASMFLPLNGYLKTLLALGAALFITITAVLVLVAGLRERLDRVIVFVLSRLPSHWGDRAAKLIDSFLHGLSVLRSPLDALAALAFSILAWLFEAGMYLMLALGFGILKPFSVFVLATALANLVTIIPSTPGYVGVFDAPIKYVLTLFGVEPNLATSYTLLLHVTLILPVTLLGFFFAWRAGFSLAQLSRPAGMAVTPTSVKH